MDNDIINLLDIILDTANAPTWEEAEVTRCEAAYAEADAYAHRCCSDKRCYYCKGTGRRSKPLLTAGTKAWLAEASSNLAVARARLG